MSEKEEAAKEINYPYRSVMTKEFSTHSDEYELFVSDNFSMQDVILQRKGDILEIAGFCNFGYYFLDELSLPRPVTIGNIDSQIDKSKDSEKHTDEVENKIDIIMDGMDFKYADNSLGVVLSAYLTHYPEYNPQDYDEDGMRELAESAPSRVLEQGDASREILKDSLRLNIASEVYRTLEPGGLYLTDVTQDEKEVMELIGFQLKASISKLDEDEAPYYYVVLQKPTDSSMVQ